MTITDTTILSLNAKLALLYSNAVHYQTELVNLYLDLVKKSLKSDETFKLNLKYIEKERRVVEDDINKIGFVSPVRRNEAPDRCTAASNVN